MYVSPIRVSISAIYNQSKQHPLSFTYEVAAFRGYLHTVSTVPLLESRRED